MTNYIHMPYGRARRSAILKRIAETPGYGLPVNVRWVLPITDPDLRALLRKGLVRRIRIHTTSKHAVTYLELVKQPATQPVPRLIGALAARKDR